MLLNWSGIQRVLPLTAVVDTLTIDVCKIQNSACYYAPVSSYRQLYATWMPMRLFVVCYIRALCFNCYDFRCRWTITLLDSNGTNGSNRSSWPSKRSRGIIYGAGGSTDPQGFIILVFRVNRTFKTVLLLQGQYVT